MRKVYATRKQFVAKNYLKATKILVAFNYILVVKIHVVVAYNIFCNKRYCCQKLYITYNISCCKNLDESLMQAFSNNNIYCHKS